MPNRGLYCEHCDLWSKGHNGCLQCGAPWAEPAPVVIAPDEAPRVEAPPAPGIKHDALKARWDLLPADALAEVVGVFTFGATKYTPWNWTRIRGWRYRYFGAALRHVWSWWRGERLDSESGLPHLAHAAATIFMLLELDMRAGYDTYAGDPTEPAWADPDQRSPWNRREG